MAGKTGQWLEKDTQDSHRRISICIVDMRPPRPTPAVAVVAVVVVVVADVVV